MRLGKIVSSDSHVRYRCRVYSPGEIDSPPAPDDYALGSFVAIGSDTARALIGVICDTVLQNPEFGAYGPRLSTAEETALFSPDYMDEACTMVTIVAIGYSDGDCHHQGAPPAAAALNAEVARLSDEEVRRFHLQAGSLRAAYLPLLTSMAQSAAVMGQVVLLVLSQLQSLFPEGPPSTQLRLLSETLSWRLRVAGLT